MKTQRMALTLLTVFCMLVVNISVAFAMPPLPSSFYGTVKIDGVDVPVGTTVTAWINGVQYATANATLYQGSIVYALNIPGDDSETSGTIEGGLTNDVISFHIGNLVAAQTGLWRSGANVQLDLAALSENTLTITSSHGTVAKSPNKSTYHIGDIVQLTATADPDWSFTAWSGGLVSTSNPASVTISGNMSITATYTSTGTPPSGLTCTNLQTKPQTASTGEKPQSKVWYSNGSWWSVFPTSASGASSAGTWVWKLQGTTWTEVLKISTRTDTKADVNVSGNLAHILLYADSNTQLASIEYISGSYQLWSTRSTLVNISLPGSEIATIDIDSTGRLWVASRSAAGEVIVYNSASPYSTWAGPNVIATGIVGNDDIVVLKAMPGKIGVLWSNQNTKRFGFRTHVDGTNLTTWTADEVPASQSAHDSIGLGMADDHLNVKVASDGTLYAAVKTSYDTAGYPKMAVLVRRPSGIWDDLYGIDEAGTRAIMMLDEVHGHLTLIYTSAEGNNPMIYRQSNTSTISFGSRNTLRSDAFNDASSIKDNYNGEFVVIYSNGSLIGGQICTSVAPSGADLVITKTDGISSVHPNDLVTYTILVSNSGPLAVTGASVLDTISSKLINAAWTCSASSGSSCTASGSGNINSLVSLPAGGSVTFTLTANVASSAVGDLVNTASVSTPAGVTDPNLTNNTAVDTDAIVTGGGAACETDATLVGCWLMEEGSGSVIYDGSSYGNNGTLYGTPDWVAGKTGSYALGLDGTAEYASAADSASLDVTNMMTVSAWIKPVKYATQDVVKKAINGGTNGFELSLAQTKTDSSSQRVFFRINQVTSGDTYRINAATMYPIDGTWMHAAATFDGTTMRLYINGTEEASLVTTGLTITANDLAVTIGAQSDNAARYFQGQVDDVRIYNRALTSGEIQNLFGNRAPVAVNDSYTTDEDTAKIVSAPGVLVNDTDEDGNPLTAVKVSDPLHGSLTLNSNGSFNYQPTANYNGSDSFTYRANDGASNSNTATVTITVNPINDAPVLAAIGNKSIAELALLSFTATATDVDIPAQTLTFSLTGAPTGASITSGGAFTWTPTEAQGPGTYPLSVCVSDSLLTTCEAITVTVTEVNVAPVLTAIGNKSIAELALLSFTATATDVDIPAQTLTFSLTGAPTGASITSGGAFTWTPTEAQGPGTYPLSVCVSDSLLTTCEAITVTVTEVNVAPVLAAIGNKSIAELALLSFTATATDVDIPAQTLTFSLTGAPTGASITSGGAFTWTPTEAQGPGTYPLSVCVSDSLLTTCEAITVTVTEVNVAPVLAAIGNKSIAELALLSFTATATDVDIPAQTLTFSLTGAPTGASITSGGAFTWTPTEAQGPGTYPLSVCVSDSLLTTCEAITVTVTEVNVAPVLTAIGNKSIAELALLSFTATATDVDIPAQTLTFSLTGAPTGASITSGGAFTWTPTEAQGPGTYPLSVCVSDSLLTTCEAITVTVTEVNVAPVLTAIGNKSIAELALLSFTATATDVDIPAQTLTFSLTGAPTGASITSGGAFTWTPTEAQGPDTYSFTVNVCDNGDPILCNQETISVSVTDSTQNQNPVAVDDSYSTDEDTTLVVAAPGVLENDTDADGNPLTAVKVSDPLHGSLTLNSDGSFNYQPDANYNGSDSFTYKANDGTGDSNIATVTITINSVNDAPVCIDVALVTNKNTLGETDPICTDVDNDTLTYSIVTQPGHGLASVQSGKLTYTPNANYIGSDSFTYKANDGSLDSNDGNVAITVNNTSVVITPPTTPSLTSPASNALLFDLTPRFDWSNSSLPSGTVFDQYQLQVATDAGFAGLVIDEEIAGLTNSEYTPLADLSTNTLYYWRVRAFNVTGQYSSWSAVRYFREAMLPAVLSTPLNGASQLTLRPEFDWENVAGASSYTIQVSNYSSMSSPIVNVTVIGSGYVPTKDLTKNKTLYWRVRANGANGPSLWSEVRTLVSPNSPTTPSLTSPASNALLYDLTPRFDWSNSSLPSGTVFDQYQLQVATDAGFAGLVIDEEIAGLTNSEYTPLADLSTNTLYYWRVRAFNVTGQYSSWSAVRYFREAMLPAVLSTPLNGASQLTLRPEFDWENVAGASSYTIQVSSYSSMSLPIVNVTVIGSGYVPTKDLTKNKTLYWRVRANGANGPSLWSEVRTLVSPNSPTTPSLTSPAANALLFDLTPRFDWSNSSLPSGTVFDQYQLQVATDAGFAGLVIDEEIAGLTNSEYTPLADLSTNTLYYWRVRAFNVTGQYSSWSAVRYFREAMLPAVLSTPLNGASQLTLRPEFDWENVAGASSYTIQVSNYSSMSLPIVNATVIGSGYVPTKDLTKNKTLYWRVRANGANGPSLWSEVRTLVSPNSPTTPSLTSPAANALLFDLTPRFDWSNSSLPSGTVFDQYQLQVATDAGFTGLVIDEEIAGLTNSEYTPLADLSTNTLYYWRVRAFNVTGQYSSWSAVRYFREAMLPAVLSTPLNGASQLTLRPEFDWENVAGASSYTIQVSSYSSMSLPIVNVTVIGSGYVPTKDLTKNKTLYWRVRANGANGPSLWSEVRTFKITLP